MVTQGIVVHWGNACEFIEIDFSNISNLKSIDHSSEWCLEDKIWREYKINSQIKWNNLIIEFIYKYEENTHLNEDEICWGKSTIDIKLNEITGSAFWDDFNDKNNNSECTWDRLDTALQVLYVTPSCALSPRKQESQVSRITNGDQ